MSGSEQKPLAHLKLEHFEELDCDWKCESKVLQQLVRTECKIENLVPVVEITRLPKPEPGVSAVGSQSQISGSDYSSQKIKEEPCDGVTDRKYDSKVNLMLVKTKCKTEDLVPVVKIMRLPKLEPGVSAVISHPQIAQEDVRCTTSIYTQLTETPDSSLLRDRRYLHENCDTQREFETVSDSSFCDNCHDCAASDKSFTHMPSSHECTTATIRPFACSDCELSFYTEQELRSHCRRDHKWGEPNREDIVKDKVFICSHCGKSFLKKSYLLIHLRTHSGIKPYQCSSCSKDSNVKSVLAKHKFVHSKVKAFSCADCGKTFAQKSYLQKHTLVHSGIKPYQCSICNKTFLRKHELAGHKLVHSKLKAVICSVCKKRFARKQSLQRHMRSHTGKPYQCSTCSEAFCTTYDLTRHERVHSKVKPFGCSDCGKRFSHRSTLLEHIRAHSGVKPHQCSTCSKAFSAKSELTKHERVHTKEKPFCCSDCGKRFGQKSHLQRHTLRHISI